MESNNASVESLVAPVQGLGISDPPSAAGDSRSQFDLLKTEGNSMVQMERFVDALQKYEQAWEFSQSDDDRAMILNNRGVVYQKLGDTAKALETFTEALALKPEYIKAFVRRSQVYRKQGEYMKAIEDFAEANVLCVKGNHQMAGLAEVGEQLIQEYYEEQLKKIKETDFGLPTPRYVEHFLDGFYCDPVSRIWKDPSLLQSENGDESSSGFAAAMAAIRAKDYSKVVEHCTDEIKGNVKYKLEALNLRATMHFFLSESEQCLADLTAITEDETTDDKVKSSAHLKAALCQNFWATCDAAAFHFAQAEKLWKGNADVYYHAAVCLVDRHETMPATALLEKGIEECPDPKQSALLHTLRLSVQSAFDACTTGRVTADEVLAKIKELENSGLFDSPSCYELAAQALLVVCETDGEAMKLFDKAVEMSGGDALYKLKKDLAAVLRMEDRQDAIKRLEPHTEIPDVASVAYFHLAEIMLLMNDLEKALEYMDKSVETALSIYDAKMRLGNKIDFQYSALAAQKLRKHGIDIMATPEAVEGIKVNVP